MKRWLEFSGWQVIVWAGAALLVEVALSGLEVVTLPDWLARLVPLAAGFLRLVLAWLRSQSLDMTGYPPELQARVGELLERETKRWLLDRKAQVVLADKVEPRE
jgi:hypothetical protein